MQDSITEPRCGPHESVSLPDFIPFVDQLTSQQNALGEATKGRPYKGRIQTYCSNDRVCWILSVSSCLASTTDLGLGMISRSDGGAPAIIC